MTDRPRFDVDDTTSSYSPPPSARPRWVDQGWGASPSSSAQGSAVPAAGTPHWYDPTEQGLVRSDAQPAAGVRSHGRRGRRLHRLVGMGFLAVAAGSVGAALTVAALGAGGFLARPSAGDGSRGPYGSAVGGRLVVNVERSDITEAVARVSPAVVTITSRAAIGDLVTTDPLSLPATGVGSGVIFSDDRGLVLTARHVVCGADALTVKLLDGRELPATTYGVDTLTDLAIVQIDPGADDLPAARVGDSSTLQPGQVAIVIGSPMGGYVNSVTSGVISATGRDVTVTERCGTSGQRVLRNLVQTDAAINPGNSGGPLVDATGRVIGISTAVAGDAQGIGFAIPINIARPIMEQAIAGKRPLTRPWMGIYFDPVTPALVSRLDLPVDYGVLVRRSDGMDGPAVVADSPAAAAGLQDGDLITAINDERIDAAHPLDDLLAQYGPDEALVLSVLRSGQPVTVRLTLGTRPAQL